jgi:hypothetical protein
MRSIVRLIVAVCVPFTVAACQTVATAAEDRPARIVNADGASRAALQTTVNDILNTEVLLADDALTGSSLLVIERNPPRTLQNPNPQGLIMEAPIQFRLVINGSDCILVDERDSARYVLSNTECEAE